MNSIKDIIPHVIAPLSRGSQSLTEIGQWWLRHYGEGKKTVAIAVKDGTLTVHVDCAGRRFKMEQERGEYLKHVQTCFPNMQRIIFKVGKII